MKRVSAATSAMRRHPLLRTGFGRRSQRYTTATATMASLGDTRAAGVELSTLRRVGLFSCLAEEQLTVLSRSVEHRTYRAQRPILFAEEAADGLYVILAGEVKVLIEDAHGRELTLYVIGAGEIFGEVALFDGQPHSARFDALTACDVLFIPAAVFSEHVSSNPGVLQRILGVMAHRRRYAHHTIHRLAFMDVHDRVVAALIEASSEERGEWFVGPGCQHITKAVGATPEMVNRVIRDMIRRGIVRRHAGKLLIRNRASLCQMCANINGGCPAVGGSCLDAA